MLENKYLWSGKERQTDLELNWDDFGWRSYDPALGRFHTQDRFAEKYYSMSPYQYAANNPILNIDVNGDSVWVTNDVVQTDPGTTINKTVHITGMVLNQSSGNVSPEQIAHGVNERLNSQGGTQTTKNADGTTTTVNTSFNASFTVANSMDELSSSDHLIVAVDDVEGSADPNLGGGGAAGLARTGQVAYVEGRGGVNSVVHTAFHEVGHNLGLSHPGANSASDPMSYAGQGANFSSSQVQNIVTNAQNGTPNRGGNSVQMRSYFPSTKAGTYGTSSNSRPFQYAPAPNARIPIPLRNPRK